MVVGVGSIKRNAIHSVGTVTDKLPMLSMVNVLLIVFLFVNELHSD